MTTTRAMMLLIFLSLLFAVSAPAQTSSEQAHTAFIAGRHDDALRLYEQHLAQNPRDTLALLRTAMMLSWKQRFPESLKRLDELLAIDPENIDARLHRAKVLSWSKRFREAEAEYRRVLEKQPNNSEALLGHARVLSWSGNQAAARTEYQQVLGMNEGDAAATVGVAQTWAWSGHPAEARKWYEKALEIDPEMMAARLGVAHLDLAVGDVGEASRIATDLSTRYPNDPDVANLVRAVNRARTPWLGGSFEAVDDSENNQLDISRLEGGWVIAPRTRATVGVTHYGIEGPQGEGSINSPSLTLVFTPRLQQRITARIGADFIERSNGEEETEMIGGLSWQQDLSARWKMTLAADHDSFRYSVPILDNGITMTTYGARLSGNPSRWFRTTLGAGGASYSDDNTHRSADLGAWLRIPSGRLGLEIGYVGRYLDFDQRLAHGYFDPQNFRAHIAQLLSRGAIGSEGYWVVTLEQGIQSFRLGAIEVEDDELFGWSATLGIPIGDVVAFELSGGESDYALRSATGFESRQFSFRVRITPTRRRR